MQTLTLSAAPLRNPPSTERDPDLDAAGRVQCPSSHVQPASRMSSGSNSQASCPASDRAPSTRLAGCCHASAARPRCCFGAEARELVARVWT